MRIIVIDDETDALTNFLVNVVEDKQLEYKMFRSNPEAAIEYVQQASVDAAFLDINMPKINGVDLAESLIKASPSIRIVFISGYTQDEKAIKNRLKDNLKCFCYKPYGADRLNEILAQISAEAMGNRTVFIRTFGTFEVFVDSKAIKFSSAKSKELLALLVDKNGAHISMGEAISLLWPDKNSDYGKIRWRDAVWRLRKTLSNYALSHIVDFSRAQAKINKSGIECDYWDFLDGLNKASFNKSYMPDYDWSIETQSHLEVITEKNT